MTLSYIALKLIQQIILFGYIKIDKLFLVSFYTKIAKKRHIYGYSYNNKHSTLNSNYM